MGGFAKHYLLRHWQGRMALLPTLVLSLLALRLAISSVSGLKPAAWPLLPFAALTGLSGLVLLWQIVGSLRAIRRDGGGAALAGGMFAVLASLVMFASAEFDGYASRAADVAGLPPVMPLPVQGDTMRLEGALDWPLYARVCLTLQRQPGLKTVALSSQGGLVPVARAMAKRISERGLDTRADGLCASACTLVFMAGERRELGPEGSLGFHGYRLHRSDPLQNAADEQARDIAWLRSRGVSRAFLQRAFATPQGALWRPDAARLKAAGVLSVPTGAENPPAPAQDSLECGDIPDQLPDKP